MAATVAVNEKTFDAFLSRCQSNCYESGYDTVLVTPQQDLEEMEGLLGMAPGELAGQEHTLLLVKEAHPEGKCKCGRTPSFLDIILSALKAHPAGFLAEALRGNMGFLITRTVPPIFCKGCKGPIKAAAYACKTYAC